MNYTPKELREYLLTALDSAGDSDEIPFIIFEVRKASNGYRLRVAGLATNEASQQLVLEATQLLGEYFHGGQGQASPAAVIPIDNFVDPLKKFIRPE